MINKTIQNMTKDELIEACVKINQLMDDLEKCYAPYVGRSFDSMTAEETETIRKISTALLDLTAARSDIRYAMLIRFNSFIM